MQIFHCIKYSYYNSEPKDVQLIITNNMVLYKNIQNCCMFSNNNKIIKKDDIIGIIYGPRTTTFKMVKRNIKPWNTISIVFRGRTYDFELKDIVEVKKIIRHLKVFRNNNNLSFKIPWAWEVNNDSIWMVNNINSINRYENMAEWLNSRYELYTLVNNVSEDNECPICLENFILNEVVSKLNCGHIYHIECIKNWLNTKKNCPTCRTPCHDPLIHNNYYNNNTID